LHDSRLSVSYTLAAAQGIVEKAWLYNFAIGADDRDGLVGIRGENASIHLGNATNGASDSKEHIVLLEH
jgi:hypothetical protein